MLFILVNSLNRLSVFPEPVKVIVRLVLEQATTSKNNDKIAAKIKVCKLFKYIGRCFLSYYAGLKTTATIAYKFFASFQKISISVRLMSFRDFPFSAALSSKYWNLLINFLFVFSSASSGLMFKKRA
jgi:hypothetical protein